MREAGGDTSLRVGVACLVETPMAELAALAVEVERLGFDEMWIPDERLLRNVYVSLATIAHATSVLELGVAVTNPYTRHPATTAAAAATVDELSGGRTRLALGAGAGLGALGLDRVRPVAAIREATRIVRALTAGDTVDLEGDVFTVHGARLDFAAVRQLPVYLAARGPKILELAGEIADGAIIGGFADAAGLAYAHRRIDAGLAAAGRTAADLDRMAWLYVSAASDPRAAREAVCPIVLTSLVSSRPILGELGVEMPARLTDHLDATGWASPRLTPREASELLPDAIVDAFAVYGTPETCARRIHAMRAMGVDHVGLVLFPAAGDTHAGLATELAAHLGLSRRT